MKVLQRFNFSKGIVEITAGGVRITHTSITHLISGGATGEIYIKRASITGIVDMGSALIILASGLPTIKDVSLGEAWDNRDMPNAIMVGVSEGEKRTRLYNAICEIIDGTYAPVESDINEYKTANTTTNTTTPIPYETNESGSFWTCSCGTKNKLGSLFCKECAKYR